MTVSAAVKFIPKPPAQVLNKNTNFLPPFLLNSYIYYSQSSIKVLPSIQQYSNYL